MDEFTKNLSIDEAKRLISKFIDDSDITTIEQFWFIELDNIHLSVNDSTIYDKILSYKRDNSTVSNELYNSCIKGRHLQYLIKKNWRRLWNNDIIEKYYKYIHQDLNYKETVKEKIKENYHNPPILLGDKNV